MRGAFGDARPSRIAGVTALAASRRHGLEGRDHIEFSALRRSAPSPEALGQASSRFHLSGF
jgi:hypothetical protein